jgi:hypothetical protein
VSRRTFAATSKRNFLNQTGACISAIGTKEMMDLVGQMVGSLGQG